MQFTKIETQFQGTVEGVKISHTNQLPKQAKLHKIDYVAGFASNVYIYQLIGKLSIKTFLLIS